MCQGLWEPSCTGAWSAGRSPVGCSLGTLPLVSGLIWGAPGSPWESKRKGPLSQAPDSWKVVLRLLPSSGSIPAGEASGLELHFGLVFKCFFF